MSAPKWHAGRMIALDTETTGTDPATARIVTAAIVHHAPGARPRTMTWIIDPGVDVPDEAAQVHGWTNARIAARVKEPGLAVRIAGGREQYMPAATALFEIAAQAAVPMGLDVPLVVHNAAYDLTLLEHELLRNDVPTLASRPAGIRGVVDPMVIEKQYDPYRKQCYKAPGCDPETQHHDCGGCRGGKVKCGGCGSTDRTLGSLCRHYGIVHAGAHDASGDAVAAIRLAIKLAAAWPEVARWKLATLHQHQVTWRREQADGLRSFFDRVGKAHDGMCPAWPVHTEACASAHREVVPA